ncbi:MAG: nitroreductase family protein, partial [Ilumatobacteraceae bacterium]|nr:nitroreductase family protein [Ilumatobacteraceae bacterium]
LPTNSDVHAQTGYYGSLLPAVWSFMLAARSRGLGTAYTTLHLKYEQEAAQLLGLPDTVTQLALIPVAYYTGEDFKVGKRRPAEEITYFNSWKSTL